MVAGVAWGANSKATVQVKDKQIFGYTSTQPWTTILTQRVKTASDKDILTDVSLVCGLYTFTKVASKSGIGDTEFAKANIRVRVLLTLPDSDTIVMYAEPDGEVGSDHLGVVFSERLQQLSAKFAGYFNTEGVLTEEEVSLLLETLDAHSFNFALIDVPQGTYDIKVQATISSSASNTDPLVTEAKALINEGSVSIEEVRMIKEPAFEYVIE
jgi:hypothetical protein